MGITSRLAIARTRLALKNARFALALCVLFLAAGDALRAATLPSGFSETLVTGGISNGTAMTFAPDGRLFVCQQGGQLRVVKNGTLLSAPFVSLSVDSNGERGLLGVAFDPNFATNNFVYVYYTVSTTPRHNRVSRFTANGDVAVAGSETLILQLDNLSGATNHNGGAIHFGPDGKLYVAVGENANGPNAQTLNNRLGKMLRVNSDGSIPSDNPFFNTASGANRSIWALGLRNPFTFAFQPGTTRMFINDVGQSSFEEINDGIAGSNYGWPTTEGPTTNPNFRGPLFAYGRSPSSTGGCSITGGAFYNPATAQFPASYVGKYFFADFCSGWIRVLDPSNNTAADFATGIANPVDLQVGPDGRLYYLARGNGQIWAIQSNAVAASRLQNISTRGNVQPGERVMIAGFIITGNQTKRVMFRGLGPSIRGAQLPDVLEDPFLELHGPDGSLLATNDNWQSTQRAEIEATGIAPTNTLEAAIIATLPPAAYTAVLLGRNDDTGIALGEAYDLEPATSAQFGNISTRGFIMSQEKVLIGGFILGQSAGNSRVLLRALGPSLANKGVTNPLPNPTIRLHNNNGDLVRSNNDWNENPGDGAEIAATGIPPEHPLESAIVISLQPGSYTAVVEDSGGAVGVGMVEVYRVQ